MTDNSTSQLSSNLITVISEVYFTLCLEMRKLFPQLNARALWHKRLRRNFLTEVEIVQIALLSTWTKRDYSLNKSTRLDNHMKDLESQSEKQKNKSEVMKADKSFAADVELEKENWKNGGLKETKCIGLLTIPTGKKEEIPYGVREENQLLMKKIALATRNTVTKTPTRDWGSRNQVCPRIEVMSVEYRLCCHAGMDDQKCIHRKLQVVLLREPLPWDCSSLFCRAVQWQVSEVSEQCCCSSERKGSLLPKNSGSDITNHHL